MAYVDSAYYSDTYKGLAIVSGDFDRLAQRASEIVDCMTLGRAGKVMEKYSDSTVTSEINLCNAVKSAAAAQTEMLSRQGEDAYTGGSASSVTREELGNAALTYDASRGAILCFGIPVSGIAVSILSEAGLLYRGV